MDPLTALGVAGNVIQFLDFGSKLVSKTVEIYKSPQGSSVEYKDLAAVSEDLEGLCTKLKPPEPLGSTTFAPSRAEAALKDICERCTRVAEELIATLNQLKVKATERHRTWKSLRSAFKSVWNKDDIETLEKRLSGLREELNLRVLDGVR